MKKRRLGNSNIEVSPLGFGCMGLTHAYGTSLSNEESAACIKAAFEMGYNFFDTAECYTGEFSDGTVVYNEDALGLAISELPREKLVIATKTGVDFVDGKMVLDSSPQRIRNSLEKSLKRLQTDYVDLYYLHRIDPKVEPEVVAQTMGELIKKGKIKAWGISVVSEDYLRRAHAITPVSAVEEIYNMIDRKIENKFNILEELDIALVTYTPLAKGFLSGKYKERPVFDSKGDNRGGRYQFSEEGFKAYQVVLDLINEYASLKNATATQISLAWQLAKKDYIIPIPGSRTVSHMQENLDSANIELSKEEVKAIDEALNAMNLDDSMAKRKDDPYKKALNK